MTSKLPRRVARTLSILPLIGTVGLLSACAQPIQLTQAALPCGALVDNSGLLKPTPAANLLLTRAFAVDLDPP